MNADQRKDIGTVDAGAFENADESQKARERRTSVREVVTQIAQGFLWSLLGYLFGICGLPFGAYPLGMALLCAADKKTPYILAGVCLSAIQSDKPVVWVCAYLAAFIIRILVRLTVDMPATEENDGVLTMAEVAPKLFTENVFLRMATSCVGVFIIGIYKLIEGGFLYYDLYGTILAMVVAPAAVILTHGIFNGAVSDTKFACFSASLLSFGAVYAAREVKVYGISLAAFGAMFLTLYVCRRRGIVRGVAAGIISGLAYSPIFAPAFIFAALAAGALWRVSAIFAATTAFSVGIAWGLYVDGIGALTSLMSALLAAALIFAVLDKLFFRSAEKTAEHEEAIDEIVECALGEDMLGVARLDSAEQRIKGLCETFSEMSKFFYELGERTRKPLAGDIKQICDNAFDACCGNCKNREICWEENYTETIGCVASVSAHVHRNGRIYEGDVHGPIRDICERLPDITDEINHNCALHARQLLLCDKTEIFALDYEAISDLLAAAMSGEEREFEICAELSEKLCDALGEAEIGVRSAVVYGNRKRRVMLEAESAGVFYSRRGEIVDLVSRVCGRSFADSAVNEGSDGRAVMLLSASRAVCVEYAKRSVMAGGEDTFCGDTVSLFEDGEDRFYSFISDGMGSGRDAALTSGICAMFMQKMLASGNRCDTSLRMLNGFLRNKGGGSMHECSATVDLMELDLVEGKAAFYKSGAAPTYVFRDGSLFKLRSKTVPVGIIRELDAKKISFDVCDGDVIVMVSDGVTQGKDECPWLFEMLKRCVQSEGLSHTADMIVERARCENGNDDISVAIIKIGEVVEKEA